MRCLPDVLCVSRRRPGRALDHDALPTNVDRLEYSGSELERVQEGSYRSTVQLPPTQSLPSPLPAACGNTAPTALARGRAAAVSVCRGLRGVGSVSDYADGRAAPGLRTHSQRREARVCSPARRAEPTSAISDHDRDVNLFRKRFAWFASRFRTSPPSHGARHCG